MGNCPKARFQKHAKKADRKAKHCPGTERTTVQKRMLAKSARRKAPTSERERFRPRARNYAADQGMTYSQKDTQSELLWVSGLDGFNLGIANTAARVHQLTRIIAKYRRCG